MGTLFSDPYFIYVLGTGFIAFALIFSVVWTDFLKHKVTSNLLLFITLYLVIGIILILSAFGLQYT